jgi:hypothetical protein
MSDSTFNADQFLGTQIEGAGETKYYPCPVGEYMAQVSDIKASRGQAEDGRPWTAVDITWEILDEGAKTETHQDRLIVQQRRMFLDMTPQGTLDFGRNKNVQLSRLRAALGQNRPDRPWTFSHLKGGMARVRVTHRNDQNGDPQAQVVAATTA